MTSSYSIPKPITHFRIHKKRYSINEEYQREIVWSKKEKQFLIDSIIKNFAIPQIFLRKLNTEKFEIVDGQQRLTAIWQFLKNDFPLLAEYSGDDLGGRTYEKLPTEAQDTVDSYNLNLVILEGYDDENIRKLFRRLQAGKPLTPGEKLNAFPGTVTLIMRKLSTHKIFSKIKFALNRISSIYGALSVVSYRLGISVIPTRNIEDTAVVIERIAYRKITTISCTMGSLSYL